MIKTLNNEYLDELVYIENSCFSHPLSKDNILKSINNEKYTFLGFEIDKKLVGYASIFIVADEAYINNVAVLDKFRKQGIGKRLVDEIINISKENKCTFITLEVRESNFPAISLYEKIGFKKITVRNNYYNNEYRGVG